MTSRSFSRLNPSNTGKLISYPVLAKTFEMRLT
jgi:hypothetical protein